MSLKHTQTVSYSVTLLKCMFNIIAGSEDFEGAPLVMFVAIAEPRMLLVSKTEESQLGPVYEQARRLHSM